MEDFYPSAFVKSVAGRDKDRIFIVMSLCDQRHVFISDGRMRRVEKPKKKKIKHLKLLGQHSEFIGNKLAEGGRVSNSDVREEISRLSGGQGS
ncbi:MAG: RNA-binding protein [Clostridia bacterium]|nr:RNA-binding protein [Clostridia bacterium]